MTETVPVFATPSPRIRLVAVDRPWTWLAKGWSDLVQAPQVSLAYGGVLVVVSFVLTLGLYLFDLLYLLLPLAAGFMFLAPALAVGLYDTSRRLAAGEACSIKLALGAWRRSPGQIASLGLVLMFCHLVWVRIATLLYPLFFDGPNPRLADLPNILFFSPMSLPFLVTGTVIGGIFAVVVFALSVVSFPMVIDRDVSTFSALATSVAAVRHNWRPMALWAALISVFITVGLALFYIGLAVALPLIGHASWHCYKDVVE
ncbi:MAG: DUF2189 domain-containing protein [Alphaproteobacteria bacterium]